ncbi:MAG: RNA polymerase sigma factor [Prevotellaceae bacterium]|nr:RNA polymerase sigma factor [Prevotellaceae bacterium]
MKQAVPESTVTKIFTTYRERLLKFIRSRIRHLEDAEDILQEVFYQFVRMDTLDKPLEQISAWLYRVARNKIIDYQRKKKEYQFPILYNEDDEYIFEEIADIISDTAQIPEMEYLRLMILEEIKMALCDLPEEQRIVFELAEFLGLSVKEIAKKTNTPINTVLSRKHYAVVHMRTWLKDFYADVFTETI